MSTHQRLASVAMPYPKCGEWTDGVCQVSTADSRIETGLSCAACCPVCKPAQPLAEGEVKPVVGTREELFGGEDA